MTSELLTSTAERTLALVELLLAHPDGLGAQELIEQMGLPRSSLFLLLNTLKRLGYAEQAERRGRYRPGVRMQSWRLNSQLPSRDLLSAFYHESSNANLEETLALFIPGEEGALLLAQSEGRRQVRSVFSPGQAYPELKAVREALYPNPSQSVCMLGYCLAVEGESLDLALPICRDGSTPSAVLLLSAPSHRWTAEALLTGTLDKLRAMAARLSYQIGASFYTPYLEAQREPLPASGTLSDEEITTFLQGPWTARLACIRPSGHPHVIPVWQEWDGQKIWVIAWKGSQWAEFLLLNPNLSLTVDEPWLPFRRVVARGQAMVLPADAPEIPGLLERMTRRYLGQSAAGVAAQVQNAFCITPETLRGWQGLSGLKE